MNSIATDGKNLQQVDKSVQHTEIDLKQCFLVLDFSLGLRIFVFFAFLFCFGFGFPPGPGDLCFFFVLVLVFPLGGSVLGESDPWKAHSALDEGAQGGRFRVTFYVVEEYSYNCKELVSVEQQSILDCNGVSRKIAKQGQKTKSFRQLFSCTDPFLQSVQTFCSWNIPGTGEFRTFPQIVCEIFNKLRLIVRWIDRFTNRKMDRLKDWKIGK